MHQKPFLFKPSPRQKGEVRFQSPPHQYCCPEHQGWPDAVPPDSRRVREVPQKRPVLVYSSRGSQTPSSQRPASPPGPRGSLTPTRGGGEAPRCALVQAPGLGMYVARRGGSDTGWYRAGPRFALPAAPPRAPLRSGAPHGLTCCSSRVLWHCPQVLLHLVAPRAHHVPGRPLHPSDSWQRAAASRLGKVCGSEGQILAVSWQASSETQKPEQ